MAHHQVILRRAVVDQECECPCRVVGPQHEGCLGHIPTGELVVEHLDDEGTGFLSCTGCVSDGSASL